MSRLVLSLLEALGQAFCEKGRRALQGYGAFGDVLHPVADCTLRELRKHMPADQIRVALAETAAMPPADYAALLASMMNGLGRVQSVPFKAELQDYLSYLPLTIQQMFHRPSDPNGHAAPDKLDFYKPEQLLPYLPPRRPHFQPGARPDGLDHWELRELRGLGECGEVWIGHDSEQPDSPSALKFAIDKEAKKRFLTNALLFEKVFELNEIPGVVPLRSVYIHSDPPCLEYAYVSGYDLTGLLHEWNWKHHHAMPGAALKLVRRIADVLAKAHALGVVHRDLKPSNILVHPSEYGKFTLWITDFGWGQIEAERSLQLHRTGGTPIAEQTRLALRGAYTPLYASPQQNRNETPAPTDDIHALGLIWYQLLKRDPHATAPVGSEWADEFLAHGFTRHQAKLLKASLSQRAEDRPADGAAFLAALKADPEHAIVIEAATPRKGGNSGNSTPANGTAIATRPRTTTTAPAVGSASQVATSLLGSSIYHPIAAKSTTTLASKFIRNSVGMCLVAIPAGRFEMGSDSREPGHRPDEGPRHTVSISGGWHMSVSPVTQAQYEKVMGRNPSFFNARTGGASDYPVESVTWQDAERFCRKLSRFGDEDMFGRIYRLPTEAEWEYACRAGCDYTYHGGDKLEPADAHYAGLALKGQGHPCSVGQHAPNAWGLCDMHGNVEEWVSDWYCANYFQESPAVDPKGPIKGEHKVIRGGSWAGHDHDCRCACRHHQHPDKPMNTLGFRVVMLTPGER